jgi:hypothetical protein
MYGTKSNLQLQKELRWGSPGWSAPFAFSPRVEWIRGHHSQFFASENVRSLSAHVDSFLRGEGKNMSFVSRIKDLLLILIHYVPWAFSRYAGTAK